MQYSPIKIFSIFVFVSLCISCQTSSYQSYQMRFQTVFHSRMMNPLLDFSSSSFRWRAKERVIYSDRQRKKIVEQARKIIGQKDRKWKDSAFFVHSLYKYSGIDVFSRHSAGKNYAAEIIHDFAEAEGILFENRLPSEGDLVFFQNTHDRNKNTKPDDGITLVGIVESIDSYQTVSIITTVSGTVLRYKMNRKQQNVTRNLQTQKIINHSFVSGYQPTANLLTAQAFVSYGSVF